jgi:hypothetical protein
VISAERIDQPQRVACARCDAAFSCEPTGDCWCKHEPARLPMPTAGESCMCAECLRQAAVKS